VDKWIFQISEAVKKQCGKGGRGTGELGERERDRDREGEKWQ